MGIYCILEQLLVNLERLDHLQTQIQRTYCSTFQSLSHRHNAAIIGLVCHLPLDGEGRGNMQDYCPRFCHVDSHHQSGRLHTWDPAAHLRLIDPCDLTDSDVYVVGQVVAVQLWNSLLPDLLLTGYTWLA